ncbi:MULTISPECIES: signal recognition particle-docking protein FtsY [Vagococcus]|uniref:Signal recognition particle receptor FtsY n=1 Tax=Vagococcus fluvialis bH819 TaxID=1255619 RepID=A0A1X6WMY3_9ENTE|nr:MULTISPECIES: signal recognition particle-docking protein FtsY [Vagococcus]SLM85618.1 Signal recognition particle receptor protein FtsY (=alpha subunit) (TC 3.A.5.1.1) [Vagococcus fluvialis bH819]HCM89586.1 signal recognition particle-docking protein FtsY [Vagococcus sp.]
MGFFDKIKKAVLGEKPAEIEKQEQIVEEEIVAESLETPQLEETTEPVIEEITETTISESIKIEEESNQSIEVEEPKQIAEEIKVEVLEPVAEPEPVKVEIEQPKEEHVVAETTVEKYDKGLEKSRKTFGQFMNNLFSNFRMVDDEFFEDLEESLISADVGFETAMRISDELQEEVKLKNVKKQADVQNTIIEKLVEIYEAEGTEENNNLNIQKEGPTIILFVGVNGVGKTTSIGKLAHRYKLEGKKVLLAAADTFRAGAIDQLVVWGDRAGVDVVKHGAGSDPAAVVFDAVEKTKKEDYDILLVDTAGRLQNKVHLMKELEKMKRVIEREYPSAPHEVLLVVDATTGQNAMVQAKEFKDTTDVTGIVLSKLDGTAKGGMVLAIRNELHLPVKLVGLGEKITDLEDFDPNQFVYGLFKDLMEMHED